MASQVTTIPAADQQDIDELNRRIAAFKTGQEDEERFKHYRLTRGVYGQRQQGVQMFRTKIPYGRITPDQLEAVAGIAERYTNGRLHLTTRQNIQMHYVRLEDSPAIWEELAQVGVTAREACGNTVRNITASPKAGIDPAEPFDVSPYAQATFEYFLRNPICQEMGRKIKPAFSSSEFDAAFTYFHDFGFIPRIRTVGGVKGRGFKVVIAGGLGAQSLVAQTVDEFMPEERIIPFMEACIRVFDRYGEREKRMKARMKFLVKKLGLEQFMALVEAEYPALAQQEIWVDRDLVVEPTLAGHNGLAPFELEDDGAYQLWLKTNVFGQKQEGFYGVSIRIPLGNITADQARQLAAAIRHYASDDIRITINQGLLLRFVRPQALPYLYAELKDIGFAAAGFDTLADITACPGTDTCALGVTNSTGLATILEEVIWSDYRDLAIDSDLKIKISGCMNACGQHMAAHIGFHGSSIKHGEQILPAMQIVVGGGVSPDGEGFIADKIIKLPTKRIPLALRQLLNDYEENGKDQYFNHYTRQQGKRYFYDLLKPLANLDSVNEDEYVDWGQDATYLREIGVGECAGAALDMISTILNDAKEKLSKAQEWHTNKDWAGSIYWAYTAQIVAAKALLLAKDVKCNTHRKIVDDFQEHYVDTGEVTLTTSFPEQVLAQAKHAPSAEYAGAYLQEAEALIGQITQVRQKQLRTRKGVDQQVISEYYKA